MAYIEREKLINELECLPEQGELSYLGVYDCVNTIPAADVVEVVRCKDCKYFVRNVFNQTACNRTFDMFGMLEDDFCSNGERKDGE